MNKTSLHLQPYVRHAAKPKFDLCGARVGIKSGAEQIGCAFNLFDMLLLAGFQTLTHIHYAEDVAIHVLQGTLDIYWDTKRQQAKVGSLFFQPRGTPHGFCVTGTFPALISYLTVPAGFDRFVLELSEHITVIEAMMLEVRFKVEVLGPVTE